MLPRPALLKILRQIPPAALGCLPLTKCAYPSPAQQKKAIAPISAALSLSSSRLAAASATRHRFTRTGRILASLRSNVLYAAAAVATLTLQLAL